MDKLSPHVYLQILHYLDEDEQMAWCCCCSYWYHEILRKYLRILRNHIVEYTTLESLVELLKKLPQVIKDPSQQVEIYVNENCRKADGSRRRVSSSPMFPLNLNQILKAVNYSVKKFLNYSKGALMKTALGDKLDILHMKSLEVSSDENLFQTFRLSDIPGLQELKLIGRETLQVLDDPTFSTKLQKLELNSCSISDVSMLGSIPDLTLNSLHNVIDISGLNNNQNISISNCSKIIDYSQSFANSERIKIRQYFGSLEISAKQLKKVKTLHLYVRQTIHDFDIIEKQLISLALMDTDLIIPITPQHRLQNLEIHCSERITSLVDLGWENLTVIRLIKLSDLVSLEGLGYGKNQKVEIIDCPLIRDYSPLRYVHTVTISNNEDIRLDELDHVHTLTIRSRHLLVDSSKSYDHIHTLKASNLSGIKGLERIPILYFPTEFSTVICEYFLNGGRLFNQKVCLSDTSEWNTTIYKEYLREYYDEAEDGMVWLLKK